MTLEHSWFDNPYPLVPPRCSGATLRRIPHPVKRIVYGRYRSPEKVKMCNSFLGCVLIDPTKSQNKITTLLYRRFRPTAGFSEFMASGPETREREKSMSVKPKHKE